MSEEILTHVITNLEQLNKTLESVDKSLILIAGVLSKLPIYGGGDASYAYLVVKQK